MSRQEIDRRYNARADRAADLWKAGRIRSMAMNSMIARYRQERDEAFAFLAAASKSESDFARMAV